MIEWSDAPLTRQEQFDKKYFDLGGPYSDRWGAYRDFPVHEITARHVLARRPESVLELGAARGYVLKRVQDAGISAIGLEISKHCHMTRACDNIFLHDLCETPWPVESRSGDRLCFSIAVLEHIPEEHLSSVIGEMARTCYRGLHGVDFGHKDCTLKPKLWWIEQFAKHAPGWPVEIVDKEELEQGQFPQEVLQGDGKVKLNIGSFTTMHHHGWDNLDILDVSEFARTYNYRFRQCDASKGLPYSTSTVDMIVSNHFFEHMSYRNGLEFLRDCRRVLKADGYLRLIVPNAKLLVDQYLTGDLNEFNEINDGCANSPTMCAKLWELLFSGHSAMYDWETMRLFLEEAAFTPFLCDFRQTQCGAAGQQTLRETVDMLPCLSLIVEAVPKLD